MTEPSRKESLNSSFLDVIAARFVLLIFGAIKLKQFSGLRYLDRSSLSFSFESFSLSRLLMTSAKFALIASDVFSATQNSPASDLKESPLNLWSSSGS